MNNDGKQGSGGWAPPGVQLGAQPQPGWGPAQPVWGSAQQPGAQPQLQPWQHPTVTPPEVLERIAKARRLKKRGLIPLLLIPFTLAGVAATVYLGRESKVWYDERIQAQQEYKNYFECKQNKYACRGSSATRKTPPPKPPMGFSDAPLWADNGNFYAKTGALFFLLSGLLLVAGSVVRLVGGARDKAARRQDPARVVIAHSIVTETIVDVMLGLFGTVMMLRGVTGNDGAGVFALLGLTLFAAIGVHRLILHAIRPSEADAEGLTLGFGRKLRWKDFKSTTRVKVVTTKKRWLGYYLKLQFTNGRVTLDPLNTSNWDRLEAFINRGVGRQVV